MRTRLSRPPLPVLVRYRLFGLRVPERDLAWVTGDLDRPGWLARGHAWVAVTPVLVVGLGRVGFDIARSHVGIRSFVVLAALLPLAVAFVVASRRLEGAAFYVRLRDRTLAYQTGAGPHPTFGVESPRAIYGWVSVIVVISALTIAAKLLF